MDKSDHLERLRLDVRYRRERLDIYRAKAYGPRLTSPERMRELEQEYDLAVSRLQRAEGD